MTTKEKYDWFIKALGPKKMKALNAIYEKHGNFYIYFNRLKKINDNPEQTKYKLSDAIVFAKDKKKTVRKKKKTKATRLKSSKALVKKRKK